ncbi:MAG TPA: Gfo/Idh/MocA family oxidoreductase [Vicinamibacteria bacterium]|nr:Gfo/Idh/MocA family oxidoreductase [Vicinamibacteria bacterium]
MRLCQVGCGEHARVAHGPSQARCARERNDLVLAGCCDVDAARAESFRAEFGYARAFTDVAGMLEAERPDAVVVVVPVERTVAVASLVLERGLPVLLEKPPGETPAEVDRLAEAAERRGSVVPHQVAFNRRYAPLVRELRRRIEAAGPLQHLHYEMTRVNRRDPDFSTTAIHGLDAVRYLAGCDYAEARFRYRELPELGRGVANTFVDAVMANGATAHLAFCPVAGVLVERATVHAGDSSFTLHVPMWGGVDSPGRLWQFTSGTLAAELGGEQLGDGTALFELGGFFRETVAFLDAVAAGRPPSPSLREARQSVAIAEHVRHRKATFQARAGRMKRQA